VTPEAGAGGEGGSAGAECGAKIDLTTDGKNCGRCGHDCLGGGCTLGQCEAIEIEKNQGRLMKVAVDSQFVYWGGDGTVIAKKKLDATGTTQELVPAAAHEFAYDWALAGLTLYWGNDWQDTGVRGCALPDCTAGASTLISGTNNINAMAYDAQNKTLFWDQSDGIWRKALPGGTAANFIPLTSKSIDNITTDGTFVYWTEYTSATKLSSLYKSPVAPPRSHPWQSIDRTSAALRSTAATSTSAKAPRPAASTCAVYRCPTVPAQQPPRSSHQTTAAVRPWQMPAACIGYRTPRAVPPSSSAP